MIAARWSEYEVFELLLDDVDTDFLDKRCGHRSSVLLNALILWCVGEPSGYATEGNHPAIPTAEGARANVITGEGQSDARHLEAAVVRG
jgi:hypothetical protein